MEPHEATSLTPIHGRKASQRDRGLHFTEVQNAF